MSLDFTLRLPDTAPRASSAGGPAQPRIFVRERGRTREISRAEWDRQNPGREPVTVIGAEDVREVYSGNVTHNLAPMAREAGLYELLWAPEAFGFQRAGELVGALAVALVRLQEDPERFQRFNPENGWGDWETLVEFVAETLAACRSHPEAEVSVSV